MPHDHDDLEVGGAHLNTWRNWAGNLSCRPAVVTDPWSIEGLRFEIDAARRYNQTLRVKGYGRACSPLCVTDGRLLGLNNYSGVSDVDRGRCRVRVRGGTTVRELALALAEQGLALEDMPDIDSVSVAAAFTSGTQGSAAGLGILASQITGMNLLLADGSRLWCSQREQAEVFSAARVSLGSLGIVTELELQCVPAYALVCHDRLTDFDTSLPQLADARGVNRHCIWRWFPDSDQVRLTTMNRAENAASAIADGQRSRRAFMEHAGTWLLGQAAVHAPGQCARISSHLARAGQTQGITLSARNALTRNRRIRYLECAYSLPIDSAFEALTTLRQQFRARGLSPHLPVEVKFSAGDDIPLSPACGRDSMSITIRLFPNQPYREVLETCEDVFDAHEGRPLWGSLHRKTAAELASLYPQWEAFQSQRRRLDPTGLFMNDYLRSLFEV